MLKITMEGMRIELVDIEIPCLAICYDRLGCEWIGQFIIWSKAMIRCQAVEPRKVIHDSHSISTFFQIWEFCRFQMYVAVSHLHVVKVINTQNGKILCIC